MLSIYLSRYYYTIYISIVYMHIYVYIYISNNTLILYDSHITHSSIPTIFMPVPHNGRPIPSSPKTSRMSPSSQPRKFRETRIHGFGLKLEIHRFFPLKRWVSYRGFYDMEKHMNKLPSGKLT